MRILISDAYAQKGIDVFRKAKGVTVDVKTGISPEDLKKIISRYDALCVRSKTKVPKGLLKEAKKLKVVGRAGIGVDNIDVTAATELGIVVMNTPGGNTITTAEHTISMIMALSRNIPQATASLKAGKWEKPKFVGREITGKRLGVVGLGNIGRIVADRARGLKMEVLAYDPFISEEQAAKMGVEKVDMDTLLSTSDYITVHVPKTAETTSLLNAAAFRKMKKGVRIINCARGGIVNEDDLLQAIKKGIVAGAALDVFETEPPKAKNALLKLDNVICTPHLGASTREAQEGVTVAVAEQILTYLKKKTIINAVNVHSVDPKILPALAPYLKLAEKLGSFQAQRLTAAPRQIDIEFAGEISDYDTRPIATAVMKGFMEQIDETTNYVNAMVLARGRGIRIVESTTQKPKDYSNLITVTVKQAKQTLSVSGAKFGENDTRIVQIDGFSMEATPEGFLLLIENQDKPGAIGLIGTTLGKEGINIASLKLGRKKVGSKAMLVINIDSPADKTLLMRLCKKENILVATQVHL